MQASHVVHTLSLQESQCFEKKSQNNSNELILAIVSSVFLNCLQTVIVLFLSEAWLRLVFVGSTSQKLCCVSERFVVTKDKTTQIDLTTSLLLFMSCCVTL